MRHSARLVTHVNILHILFLLSNSILTFGVGITEQPDHCLSSLQQVDIFAHFTLLPFSPLSIIWIDQTIPPPVGTSNSSISTTTMRLSSSGTRNLPLFLLTALTSFHTRSTYASTSDTKTPDPEPCTIHSTLSGSFYDVRPLNLTLTGTKTQSATNESYHARGYDYGTNFTINICGPVVEDLDDVYGVSRSQWSNISAFYKDPKYDTVYSLGNLNTELTMRGRKLLLNYTMGSPCPELDEYGDPLPDDTALSTKKSTRRKSTLLSFICDTSPALSTTPRVSFLGSPDHCSYIFEVRSRYACAGATPSHEKGTLGPGGVFTMILVIGVLAYLVGGVVYQRNVMHQRGWRQLPNYSLWAGMFSFVSVSSGFLNLP